MKRLITLLLITITFISYGQGNLNGKSLRIIGSDSTHGTVDGTIYRGSDGLLRFMYLGVHYRFATASESTTASNGLTEVGNDIRLGGLITQNTDLTAGGSFTLNLGITGSRLNTFGVNSVGNHTFNSSNGNINFTATLGSSTLSTGSTISINSGTNTSISPVGTFSVATNSTASMAGHSGISLSSNSGNISLITNSLIRLGINNNGSFSINGTEGSSGQVLTSAGSGSPPTWQTPTGTIGGSISATQVAFGSGANAITGEAAFTYDSINNVLTVPNIHGPILELASLSGGIVITSNSDLQATAATDITFSANEDVTFNANTGGISFTVGTNITLVDPPTNNNSVSQILGRNSSTGVLEYKDLSSFASGTIAGTIAATQVAFGSGADAITGEGAFNYTSASNTLQVNAGTINVLGPNNGTALLVEDDAGNNIIHAGESAGAQFLDLTGTGNVNINFSGDVGISGNTIGLSSIGDVTTSSLSSDLLFRTGSTTRLLIDDDGSFAVNGTDGTSGQALVSNGSGSTPTWQTVGGVPGGSNTQVQFNNSGVFGGDADLTFDNNPLSNVLKIGNLEISGSPSGGVNAILFNNSGQLAIGQTGSNALPLSVQNGGLSLSSSGSGDVGITVNSGAGSYFIISGLPTTCAGAPTGALANIAGVINICP